MEILLNIWLIGFFVTLGTFALKLWEEKRRVNPFDFVMFSVLWFLFLAAQIKEEIWDGVSPLEGSFHVLRIREEYRREMEELALATQVTETTQESEESN